MNKIIFEEEIIILGLLYNYEVNASRMLPQFTIKDFVEKVNINLEEMDVKINRVDKLDCEIINYGTIEEEDNKYYMLKNVTGIETARHELIKKIPFAIIRASQMPNALEVLGIQMENGKMKRLEKQSTLEDTSINLNNIIERFEEDPQEFYKKIANALLPHEREFIISQIQNKGCFNCTNGTCSVETYEKTSGAGANCIAWDNKKIIGQQLLLKKN